MQNWSVNQSALLSGFRTDFCHQYGISGSESQTSIFAFRTQQRERMRDGCIRRLVSFSFLACQGHFSSKSRKEGSEKMFPFKVQLSGNNSQNFSLKCRLVLFVFFHCYGQPWLLSLSQAMTQAEYQSSGKGGRTQIVQGPLKALFPCAPPGYSKANLGIQWNPVNTTTNGP